MFNSSYFAISWKPREREREGAHTNNAILPISEENVGVRVLHGDPNLTASFKQIPTHLLRVVLVEPLPALEDHDGEGLNGRGSVKLLVRPMREMRNGRKVNAVGTHIFQVPSTGV